jgi:hypothetical protein
MADMDWNGFIEYKLWKLVVLGILAFIGGWYGLFNSRPPGGAERHDREPD